MTRLKTAILGLCFVGSGVFKFGMTYILRLRPDPTLFFVNTVAVGIGALLFLGAMVAEAWSRPKDS